MALDFLSVSACPFFFYLPNKKGCMIYTIPYLDIGRLKCYDLPKSLNVNPDDFSSPPRWLIEILYRTAWGRIESSQFSKLTTNYSTFFISCMYSDRFNRTPTLSNNKKHQKAHIWRKVCCCFQVLTPWRVLYIPMYTRICFKLCSCCCYLCNILMYICKSLL